MKTYLKNILPRIKQFSKKLDDLTLLTNQHWVVIDEIENSKLVYIFRRNNELLISKNGKIERGRWEHIGSESFLIKKPDGDFLFRHGFFDENVLALKVDGVDEYALLINQNNYEEDINSVDKVIDFLNEKYIDKTHKLEVKVNSKFMLTKQQPEKIFNPLKPVFRNGKYGFVNKNMETYIEFIYDWAESFSEGLALVKLESKFGFIDLEGKIVIDIIYDGANTFHDGKASVNLNGKNYKIDKNGL